MKREEQIKGMLSGVFDAFAQELTGFRVVLFGSRVAGTHRRLSDFDVGVIGPSPLPLDTFYRIEDRLDDLDTLYRLDWVDLTRASVRFREEALRHTEVLYGD